MNDTLNLDLVKIEEWESAKRVEFTACKTQCSLLSHKRMEIAISETPDVLGTSIRSDLQCDDHVFNVLKEAAKC